MDDSELIEIARKLGDEGQPEEILQSLCKLIALVATNLKQKEADDRQHMTLEQYVQYIKETEGRGAMKAFAERIGVAPSDLSRILGGDTSFRLDTMQKIEKASGGRVSRVGDFVITRPRKKQGKPGRPKGS